MQRPEISALPTSSKRRKLSSEVWNHFKREGELAICQHCGRSFSGSSKDGTTHLRNHLNSKICKKVQKEKISSSETDGLENPTVTNGNFGFDEERSGLDLLRMVIKNGYPLNMVEHEDFKIFVKNLQPTFKLPSQETLKDKILCFFREEKEKLRKQFDKVLSFSLILNFWTDCGKKSKYCSFTLQFIEDGPKLMKKNIAIKNVKYNYTERTLFNMVKGVLLEWNIYKKLATITVESSCANDLMVHFLKGWLGDQGNCHPFREQIFHIRCITHVINLLVKDGLDEVYYILHKIRKAIKYMSETTIGKQKFEEVVKKLNLGGKDITSEGVPVRWDSTFFMLQIALELRMQGEAFVDLQSSDCVFPMDLSVEEWDKAKVVHKCLNVFYDAICSFFGCKCLGTNVYLRKIFDIFNSLKQWQESDIAKKMANLLDQYFHKLIMFYKIVAVFDPRTKLDFVKYTLKQVHGCYLEHWMLLNENLGNMPNLYAEFLTSQRSSSSSVNNDNSYSSDGDHPCNILDDWKKSNRQSTELEKYLQEPLEPDEELDILGWWHTKSQDSPTLWTMARDILAIPMSTSTSNSAFCIETMTLDPIFNDLDPDIIEALFCGKDWLDNPIRITPNKDNDHSTANPEPMLEISGSTSGPVSLPTGDTSHVWSGTLAPQEKHDPSNADTELMLATSCPKPLPLPTKNDQISALCVTSSGSDVNLSSDKGSEEVLEDSDDGPTMKKRIFDFGFDVDLSSEEEFEEVLEDSDNEPTMKKMIFDSNEEGVDEHETKAMEIPEEPEIAANIAMPTAPIPTTPAARVSATRTTPVSATPTAPIPMGLGSILTAPSQFEVGSSSAMVLDPVSEAKAFFTRFDQPEVNDLDHAKFWCAGSPYVDFHGFRIPEECASHLEAVYRNRGDFMRGFLWGRSAREHFLKLLGSVMNDIEHNFIDTVSTERILQWRAAIQELIKVGFAVEFMLDHLREIAGDFFMKKGQPVVDVGSSCFGDQSLISGLY